LTLEGLEDHLLEIVVAKERLCTATEWSLLINIKDLLGNFNCLDLQGIGVITFVLVQFAWNCVHKCTVYFSTCVCEWVAGCMPVCMCRKSSWFPWTLLVSLGLNSHPCDLQNSVQDARCPVFFQVKKNDNSDNAYRHFDFDRKHLQD
jgi:hypothetical protein